MEAATKRENLFQDLNQRLLSMVYGDYADQVPFIKGGGFGLQRNYPPNSGFKPAVTRDGRPDDCALLKFCVMTETPQDVMPVEIEIGRTSRYHQKHISPPWEDTHLDAPIEESVHNRRACRQPLEARFGGYSYELTTGTFRDSEGKELSISDELERIYQLHLAPLKPLRGAPFRFKRWSRKKRNAALDAIVTASKAAFFVVGRELTGDNSVDYTMKEFTGYERENVTYLSDEIVSFHGVKIHLHTAVTFCVLLTCVAIAFHTLLVDSTVKTLFFSAAIAIPLLVGLDRALPLAILSVLNCVIKLRFSIQFKPVGIKSFLGVFF